MASLQYVTLDETQDEIRLLQIDLSSAGQHRFISRIPLDMHSASYTALSYTWGDQTAKGSLLVNGASITVSTNLKKAISEVIAYWKRTYGGNKDLYLWIDQICINQANDEEKSHQVGLMGEIYRRAEQVLIWLPVSEDVKGSFEGWEAFEQWHAGRTPEQVRRKAQQGMKNKEYSTSDPMKYSTNSQSSEPAASPPAESFGKYMLSVRTAWDHIASIIKSPWWQRAWVYQEFMGARRAIFLIDGLAVSWQNLLPVLSQYLDDCDRAAKQFKALLDNTESQQAAMGPSPPENFAERCWSHSSREAKDLWCGNRNDCCAGYISLLCLIGAIPCGLFTIPKRTKNARRARLDLAEKILKGEEDKVAAAAASWKLPRFILNSKKSPTTHMPLSQLLGHSRNCLSSDARDKVYAFLNLADPKYGIKANYAPSNSINAVLTEAAKAIIIQEQRLDILAVARENTTMPSGDDILPSWVPDWATKENPDSEYAETLKGIKRSPRRQKRVFQDNNLEEKTEDRQGNTIDEKITAPSTTKPDAAKAPKGPSMQYPPSQASKDMAPVVTFHPDRFGKPDRLLKARAIQIDDLEHALDTQGYRPWRCFTSARRRFDISTTVAARPGDEVWIILGADEPYTLRKKGNYYIILGHAMIWDEWDMPSSIMQGSLIDQLKVGGVQSEDIFIA